MKIVIKAYSLLRDIIGDNLVLEINEDVSIGELIDRLRREYNIPETLHIVAIIGERIVDKNYRVKEGETIILTPQFSGGGVYIDTRIIHEEKVDLNEVLNTLSKIDPSCGSISIFIGIVKGKIDNVEVYELQYEAVEEAAIAQMKRIALEEAEKYGLKAVVIWHWTGSRKPHEITVLIATLAKARGDAIEASRSILERVKKEVPIFKLEKRSDGEYWIIGDSERYPRRAK